MNSLYWQLNNCWGFFLSVCSRLNFSFLTIVQLLSATKHPDWHVVIFSASFFSSLYILFSNQHSHLLTRKHNMVATIEWKKTKKKLEIKVNTFVTGNVRTGYPPTNSRACSSFFLFLVAKAILFFNSLLFDDFLNEKKQKFSLFFFVFLHDFLKVLSNEAGQCSLFSLLSMDLNRSKAKKKNLIIKKVLISITEKTKTWKI